MDKNKLQQAVALEKELREITDDLNRANPPGGHSRSTVCYAYAPDGGEAGLGTGKKFNFGSLAQRAVIDAFRKKKEEIEAKIEAL